MTYTERAIQLRPYIEKSASIGLTDNEALKAVELFPVWKELINVAIGDRYSFKGVLYKCQSAHTTQADWTPDITPALWVVVDVEHAGTVDDPIPYNGNMALEQGKYYSQNGVTYLCTRDTVNPVYHELSALVGLYVEAVSE